MSSVEQLEKERDRLRRELERVQAQLVALESVLATNEHLVLRSPIFDVLHLWADRGVPWPRGTAEAWKVSFSVDRYVQGGGSEVRFYQREFPWLFEVPRNPTMLFCLLPEPRR